jgi:hypothetical protein
MAKVTANGIAINYEEQGSGEPLALIPYLAADNACYAFQVAEYSKHFRCISIDPRGAGESDKPEGTYSTELFADDACPSFLLEARKRNAPSQARLGRRARRSHLSQNGRRCE